MNLLGVAPASGARECRDRVADDGLAVVEQMAALDGELDDFGGDPRRLVVAGAELEAVDLVDV